jgi:hypothetical protein
MSSGFTALSCPYIPSVASFVRTAGSTGCTGTCPPVYFNPIIGPFNAYVPAAGCTGPSYQYPAVCATSPTGPTGARAP